jgi:hypothetical protein
MIGLCSIRTAFPRRRTIAEGAVWPEGVVVDTPLFDEDLIPQLRDKSIPVGGPLSGGYSNVGSPVGLNVDHNVANKIGDIAFNAGCCRIVFGIVATRVDNRGVSTVSTVSTTHPIG